jgi:hypothetical protein
MNNLLVYWNFSFLPFLASLFAFLWIVPSVQAKTFKTPFIRFELPPNWDCKQEEAADWVCQPDNIAERSEAIVVVVTKEANDVDDVLEKYQEYLQTPRDMRDLVGNPYQSQVRFTKRRTIIDTEWIDSLHLGSEIPGFYTRYVASRKEKISGLITYSIAESAYAKYASLLDRMIDSAQIYFDPKAFDEARNSNPGSLLGSRGRNLKGRMDPKLDSETNPNSSSGDGSPLDVEQIGALVFLALVIGYVVYKRKKRGITG